MYADMHVDGKKAAVYVRNRLNLEPVCVGVYESMFRARGVLYEMDLAYQARKRVFYAPAE